MEAHCEGRRSERGMAGDGVYPPQPYTAAKRERVEALKIGGDALIARMWHGRTRLSNADAYAEFLRVRAAPDYGSVDGLERLYFLRRDEGEIGRASCRERV